MIRAREALGRVLPGEGPAALGEPGVLLRDNRVLAVLVWTEDLTADGPAREAQDVLASWCAAALAELPSPVTQEQAAAALRLLLPGEAPASISGNRLVRGSNLHFLAWLPAERMRYRARLADEWAVLQAFIGLTLLDLAGGAA